jgi:uroporphyrin-III C-methyltransferase / precorrin-2 dehydrogenase / sirohydrochlorin ferrochelatase
MHSLPIFLKLTDRQVILVGTGPAADAKRRILERAGAIIVGENLDATIAIVAVEDDHEAGEVVARLKARGVLVNATDRPTLCDFTLPAIVDRDPVLVAIGTGGASAGLAKHLRMAIEALLPPSIGSLATGLSGARDRILARWPAAHDRRHALDAALEGMLAPLSGADTISVEHWLADGPEKPKSGTESISIRSGDPDDLTLREARLLARADRIVHDPDIPNAVLGRARADAVRIASSAAVEEGAGLTVLLRWKD